MTALEAERVNAMNFRNVNVEEDGEDGGKDGPGPVMVSDTLCPAVHILETQNVHGRIKGTADPHWPWAVFFKMLKFRLGSGSEGDNVL